MAENDETGIEVTVVAPTLPPLRTFVVRKSQNAGDTEYVQAHQNDTDNGVLVFNTFKMAPDGSGYFRYCTRCFRVWHDMEEIFTAPDNGTVN